MRRRIRMQSRYPHWKVFSHSDEYLAACHYAEDAAAVVAAHGPGAQIRWGHAVKDKVWTDGIDGSAGESYDYCAQVCHAGLEKIREREGWT